MSRRKIKSLEKRRDKRMLHRGSKSKKEWLAYTDRKAKRKDKKNEEVGEK